MSWSLAPHVFDRLPALDWETRLSHQARPQSLERLTGAVLVVLGIRLAYS